VTGARQALGKEGEAAARAYLARQGVQVIAQNYSCAAGEVDLIGRQGQVLVFAEVKTRASGAFGPPQLAVHRKKQQQIVRAAQWFLAERGFTEVACRFDVVAVTVAAGAAPKIDWVQDAFPAEGVAVW